jgi:hypothetical protein
MNEIQHKHKRISNEKKQKNTMNNNNRINEYFGNYILLGHNTQGFTKISCELKEDLSAMLCICVLFSFYTPFFYIRYSIYISTVYR